MKKHLIVRSAAVALVVAATACSSQSPVNPSQAAASVAGSAPSTSVTFTEGKLSVTLTTPQPVTPPENQTYRFAEQPVTLTVKNAVTTGATALTYTFQVASDAAFTALVYTKDGVAEGTGGQTGLRIDTLAGGRTYFWRVSASSGSTAGPFSKGRAFSMLPQVVLQTPVAASPLQNATVTGTPNLTVNNVGRSGPNAPLVYQFDLSNSATFGQILFTTTVSEQSGQTSAAVSTRLTNGTYFWRARAIDGFNLVTTAYSTVLSFNYQAFSMAQAVILSSPSDLGSWAETAKITSINFNGYIEVDFDRRTGSNRWPDEPFGSGDIQYTLGMCVNPGARGTWFCSAVVQMWFGRDLSASGPARDVGLEWFYDPARWGPIAGYQPQDGETVGIFVGAGNLRGRTDPSNVSCPRVCERSNVAFVPFSTGGANYSFSAGRISLNGK